MDFESILIGEITGGDRTLISSLEGFEDLQIIGRLQMQNHSISKNDIVFAVTEGGETSSVIGTILAASEYYTDPEEARAHLFFVYNNPDEVLMPLHRSRSVLENEKITKFNLTSGP